MCKSQHRNKGNITKAPGHYKTQQRLKMDSSEGEVNAITDKEFNYPTNA
jgi:hypothetical protein